LAGRKSHFCASLRRVFINARIAALLVAEFVQKSASLFKKQQLTHVLSPMLVAAAEDRG
jgi:hypothetical protein